MRDLIDNWWILINLSFLSSGATQWSRGETHYLPRIGRPAKNKPRAAGHGNCPLSKSTVILSPDAFPTRYGKVVKVLHVLVF